MINPILRKTSISVLGFIIPISFTRTHGLWPGLQLQQHSLPSFLASYFLTAYFLFVDNPTSYFCFFAVVIPPLKNILPVVLCITDNFLSSTVQLKSHVFRDCYHSGSPHCFTILKISLISLMLLIITVSIYFLCI